MKLPLLDWKSLLLKPHSLTLLKDNLRRRRIVSLDVDKLFSLYTSRNALITTINEKRCLKEKESISSAKELKDEIQKLELQLNGITDELTEMSYHIPNDIHPDTPLVTDKVIKEWGSLSGCFANNNNKRHHLSNELIDFESSREVVGRGFPILKGKLALLELALINYTIKKIISKGFELSLPPDLVRQDFIRKCGYMPRINVEKKEEMDGIFRIKDSPLALSGTSEILLASLNSEKIFPPSMKEKRLCAVTHCFRDESCSSMAGGGGGGTLYRVKQFTKVEMFIISGKPDERIDFLEEICSIQREILEPFDKMKCRQILVNSGDLGSSAYMKYDTEVFLPSINGWGELMSASNCTDYQGRRLRIRYKGDDGKNYYCHTFNGTAIAIPRMIQGIIENYSNENGSITVPSVLREFMLDGSDMIG